MKRIWVTTAALATSLGCSRDLPDDELISSDHFSIHYRSGSPPCDGIKDALELHRAALLKWLGTEQPIHIDYYIYTDRDDLFVNSPCKTKTNWGRCTVSNQSRVEVHTTSAFGLDEHELVHAHVANLSDPPKVLSEGLAVALECLPQALQSSDLTAQSVFEFKTHDIDHYDAAGFLVRWLIDVYGKDEFLRFYKAMDGASISALQAAFEDTFGMTTDAAWEMARKVDPSRVSGCVCPTRSIGVGNNALSSDAAACGFSSRLTLEFLDSPVRIDIENVEQKPLNLLSCFGDVEIKDSDERLFFTGTYPMPPGTVHEILYASMPEGRYFLRPFINSAARLTVSMQTTEGLASQCSAAIPETVILDSERPLELAVRWTDATSRFLSLNLTEAAVRLHQGTPTSFANEPGCLSCEENPSECPSGEWPAGEVIWGPLADGSFAFPLELNTKAVADN